MIRSRLFSFVLGGIAGFTIAASTFGYRAHLTAAAPVPTQADGDYGKNAVNLNGVKYTCSPDGIGSVLANWMDEMTTNHRKLGEDLARDVVNLREQLTKAQQDASSWERAAKTENRNFANTISLYKDSAGQNAAVTVLYESSRAAVNLSLLPLPGAPRVAIGPHSELAPRWIIPGKIQPQMIGETRKAMYYYFVPAQAGDASSNAQWQGPFAPQRVTQ